MRARSYLVTFVLISLCFVGYAQSNKDAEIQRLQKLANDNEQRALRAEAVARKAEQDALHMRCLAIANELSLKLPDLHDKELIALLAIQSHNLNGANGGYKYSNRIYAALAFALQKYNKAPYIIDGKGKSISSLHGNTKNVLSVSSDGKVFRWISTNNSWSDEEILQVKASGNIGGVAVSNDGNLVVRGLTNAGKSYAEIVDLSKTSNASKSVDGFTSIIGKIIFAPDGKGFYVLSDNGQSILYCDLSTVREVISAKEKISSIAISPNGSQIAGTGVSGNLYLWNTENYSPTVYKIFNDGSDFSSVAFLPNNQSIAIGNQIGELRIILTSMGSTWRVVVGHKKKINKIRFSHSGDFMATSADDNTIRIWNVKQMNQPPLVINENSPIGDFEFSPDDTQIICVLKNEANATIRMWPLDPQKMVAELCGLMTRNLTKEEWEAFVGDDLPYKSTCGALPPNDK